MVLFRQARNVDLDACADLERRGFPPGVGAPRERFEARLQKFPEGFLVAEEQGEIIGVVNGALTDRADISDEELKTMVKHVPGGKNAVLFTVVVEPAHRGKGIAKRLLAAFVTRMKAMKKEKILLLCDKSLIPFYGSMGFRDLGLSASLHGGRGWQSMELIL